MIFLIAESNSAEILSAVMNVVLLKNALSLLNRIVKQLGDT